MKYLITYNESIDIDKRKKKIKMKRLKKINESNKYLYDIFYDVKRLPLETKKEILKWAYERSYNFHVDVLRGTKPRQTTNMDFEEGMMYFSDDSHFVVIYRRGYESWNTKDNLYKWHLEVGFRTMKDADYFMFIECDEKYVQECVEKFNLKELK